MSQLLNAPTENLAADPALDADSRVEAARALAAEWSRWFGCQPAVVDCDSGELAYRPMDQPYHDWDLLCQLARAAGEQGNPEILAEEEPLVVLAVPTLRGPRRLTAVVVCTTVETAVLPSTDVRWETAARLLGVSQEAARQWSAGRTATSVETLLRLAELLQAHDAAERRGDGLERECSRLAEEVAARYEEISLLYRLTQNLRLSSSDEELGRMALISLAEVLPAHSLVLQLVPLPESASASFAHRTTPVLLTHGSRIVDNEQFSQLLLHLKLDGASRPFVANGNVTAAAEWPLRNVKNVVIVPLSDGQNVFGWLAAINHRGDDEFGTDEGQLLGSVATILGIHSSNAELYRQQAELVAGVIRALTSAIDAKDPYTCGHSDRVSRVSVRLGQQLGCDDEFLNRLYLSGLLHDVGKIGIDEAVLRKPGRLTPAEYEHIKTHPDIGYNILKDVKKLAHLLPGVRHHHESWDGRGYPDGLAGEDIPLMARIIAVADSFDAMGSDRPYRKGMADEKLDAILHEGAGKQWDAKVVEAFFQVRDEVRQIAEKHPEGFDPSVPLWAQS